MERGNARLAAAGAFALAALGAAWWLTRGPGGARFTEPETRAEVPDAPAEFAELTALAAADGERARAGAGSAEGAEHSIPTAGPAVGVVAAGTADGTLAVDGRVVVLDAAGGEHRAESGELQVQVTTGKSGRYTLVPVREGRFRVWVAPGSRFSSGSGLLGGRAVFRAAAREQVEAVVGADVELVVRWAPSTLLRVVDAGTREDLHGLEIYFRHDDTEQRGQTHPGDSSEHAEVGSSSPLALDALATVLLFPRCTVFVRAPGYAWGRVAVDLERGGEHWVTLALGADLEVEFAGAPPPRTAELRVIPSEEHARPVVSLAHPHSGPLVLEGLAPGSVRVALEAGKYFSNPLVLAEAQAVLVAGECQHVRLDVPATEVPETVPLAGVLVLPAAWGNAPPQLSFRRLDPALRPGLRDGRATVASALREGTPDEYPFEVGAVEPGRFLLRLGDPPLDFEVDVPVTGLSAARLVVAPPGEVLVRVVDADTGAPLRPPSLLYGWSAPGGRGPSYVRADPDAARGAFAIRAAQGELALLVLPFEDVRPYGAVQERIVVGPEPTTAVLHAALGQGIALRLERNREPASSEFRPTVEAVDGDGHKVYGSEHSGQHVLFVSAPGRYRLSFESLYGESAPEPREVDVEAGALTELVIELGARR